MSLVTIIADQLNVRAIFDIVQNVANRAERERIVIKTNT